MFQKLNLSLTVLSALIAGCAFSIPVFFYIRCAEYRESWLLYLGSFFFLVVIWIHTIIDNKKRGQNESTIAMAFASHITTLAGIVVACLLSFLMLVALVPGYLQTGETGKSLAGAPANTISDKTDGLSFDVFMAATVINFSVGSFASIILPFYTKRNQTRDTRKPTPFHQKGKK